MRSDEWRELRELRLRALRTAPRAFGSTYARESAYAEERWMREAAEAAQGGDVIGVVAEEAGRWVAMARGYVDASSEAARVAWLVGVYVDPEWRGRGLGRAVSAGVVAWARVRGLDEVRLHVAEGNDPARRVYEALGFRLTGETTTLAHDASVTEVEMELRLPRSG